MRKRQISIGDFNLRVTISYQQDVAPVYDDFGNKVLGGTSTQTISNDYWANVKSKREGYTKKDGGIEYMNKYEVTLRKPINIEQGYNLTFDGKTMRIESLEDAHPSYIKVFCFGVE